MPKKTEFAPMLAAKTPADGFKYKFPVYVSPKLDGIRAIIRDGKVYSRSLKLIPNLHVQKLFGRPALNGLDGELIVGEPTGRDANGDDVMQRTTKGVMRIEGEPDVRLFIFDMWDRPEQPFRARLEGAHSFKAPFHDVPLANVIHRLVATQTQLDSFEAQCLERGYEGAMVRDPDGLYKFGRSTAKEGGLIKIKRFEDSEAVVVGFEERMHNDNEATEDELGHTKRSTHQENKRPAGDLGALVCNITVGGTPTKDGRVQSTGGKICFNIGTGFTAKQREELWAERESLVGRIVKFKSFTAAGVKEAPRFPVFLSFRDPIDL